MITDIPTRRVLETKDHIISGTALPGAGAYSAQAYSSIPFCSERVTFEVRYTKDAGAAAGAWKAQLDWHVDDGSGGEDETLQLLFDQTQFTIDGSDETGQVEVRDGVIQGPSTASAAVQSRCFTVNAPDGVLGVRLRLAETGDTSNPGTVQVVLRARRT